MKITIEIPYTYSEAFLDNLMLDPELMEKFEPNEILLPIIKSYLETSIAKDDIDLEASLYIEQLTNSGQLEDIFDEMSLE